MTWSWWAYAWGLVTTPVAITLVGWSVWRHDRRTLDRMRRNEWGEG